MPKGITWQEYLDYPAQVMAVILTMADLEVEAREREKEREMRGRQKTLNRKSRRL